MISDLSRQPSWKGPGETNWRLAEYRHINALVAFMGVLSQFADQLRLSISHRRAQMLLKGMTSLKLSLGSGTTVREGWHGMDLSKAGYNVLRVDLRRGIPVADGSVSAILAEHFFEHLYLDDLQSVIAECRRVMHRGAVIRVVSPDALTIGRLLALGPIAEHNAVVAAEVEMHLWPHDGLNWARTVNRYSHQWGQHRSLLTAQIVAQLLRHAGFGQVVMLRIDQSDYFSTAIPDVHSLRFSDQDDVNFAVEAIAC